jgi:hypothetical protein
MVKRFVSTLMMDVIRSTADHSPIADHPETATTCVSVNSRWAVSRWADGRLSASLRCFSPRSVVDEQFVKQLLSRLLKVSFVLTFYPGMDFIIDSCLKYILFSQLHLTYIACSWTGLEIAADWGIDMCRDCVIDRSASMTVPCTESFFK